MHSEHGFANLNIQTGKPLMNWSQAKVVGKESPRKLFSGLRLKVVRALEVCSRIHFHFQSSWHQQSLQKLTPGEVEDKTEAFYYSDTLWLLEHVPLQDGQALIRKDPPLGSAVSCDRSDGRCTL